MLEDTLRYERMLFDYQTTNRTDIRDGEIKPLVNTTYKEKLQCLHIRPPPLKYTHTMTDWRDGVAPPFDLLLKPKDIVHTDPRKCQEAYESPVDSAREAVQRSRPRVVMTPAVILDDVTDAATRAVLCRYTYTSCAMAAGEAAAERLRARPSLRAPLLCRPAPANVTRLRCPELPYVHPAWRRQMLEWDNRQLRTYADVDRQFWMRQKTTCKECERTAVRREIKN